MGSDVVSRLLIHSITSIYRPTKPADSNVMTSELTYALVAANQKARFFDANDDYLKDYKEISEYVPGTIEMVTKYPVLEGDIITSRDEVRVNAFYIKRSEFLSLEPFVKLFKHYQCLCEPFTGEVLLNDNTTLRFPLSFFGVDEEVN